MSFLRVLVRRARSGDGGAVAVEAAIITPLLLLIVFGIIDFGLLIKDDVAVTSAVRAVSRTASVSAPISTGTMKPTDPVGTVGNTFFTNIASQAQVASAGMTRNANTTLWVYIPTATGLPQGSSSLGTASCSTDCVSYTWGGSAFGSAAGSWTAKDVDACASDTISKVGVILTTLHTVFTPVFSKNVTLRESSVLYFEPVPAQPGPCKGT
jgi:Flp pilus assembly protein TadG